MLDLTNKESESSDNGNSKYEDSIDGREVGTSKPFKEERSLEDLQADLADMAVWMEGLDATKLPLNDPQLLCNGRAFSEVLHNVDKNFFTDGWLETMPENRTTNIMVFRSCTRKLWRKMFDYVNHINRTVVSSRWTDIHERIDGIYESDLPAMVNLGMAVVTLAHIGKNAKRFVDYSKALTSTHKSMMSNVAKMVTTVIDEMPENPCFHEISELHGSQSELNSLSESSGKLNGNGSSERRSNADQILVDAELEIERLRTETENQRKEIERLTKSFETAQHDMSSNSESGDISILEKQNEELRQKRRELEEKNLELDAAVDQFKGIVFELTNENDVLRRSDKERQRLQTVLDAAQSDLDEWKTVANQYQKEAELSKQQDKEIKELLSQNKALKSRLDHHVKSATLEDANKNGIAQLRTQVGGLTALNTELKASLDSKKRCVEQLEIQLIQHKEKVKELEDRKDELIEERNRLENQLIFKEAVTPRSLHESMFEAGNLSFDEKNTLPLEIENKRLTERIQELESLEPLKGELITLKSKNGVLEEEKLFATKQIEELQQQIEDLQENLLKNQEHASGDVVGLKIQLEKAEVEAQQMREAKMRAETNQAQVDEILKKRTAELEVNATALQKAKAVIDELEYNSRPVSEDSMTSVQAFKEMKEENEKLRQKVEKLEIELNTVTQGFEQENRLLTSASHQQVLNRSIDEVMSMRAHAGSEEPQTLLDTQKMSGALPWSILVLGFLVFIAWMFININSALNAPPNA